MDCGAVGELRHCCLEGKSKALEICRVYVQWIKGGTVGDT